MIRYKIVKEQDCDVCGGKGYVWMNSCRECAQRFEPEQLDAAYEAGYLPCGHSWASYVETDTCSNCEGQRIIRCEVDLVEVLLHMGVMSQEQIKKWRESWAERGY